MVMQYTTGMKILLAWLIALLLLVPTVAFATIGVGVGTGKIQVDEKLKPGTIYELPSLSVINTGDQAAEYEVVISYHETQPELKPPEGWFIFTPQKFHLEPGKVQLVEIKLNLPLRMEPGNYFAYLEGHPNIKSESGNTSIGVAAAAKLYFTVQPGNFFEGIFYKLISFWKVYSPWPQRIAIGIGVVLLITLLKKFFNIEINVKKTKTAEHSHTHDKTEN